MSGLFILALVAAVFWWLMAPGARRAPGPHEVEPVDRDELEAAEREVRDLDIHQRPEDGSEGDDWGPGAAKRKT
jgi:hypothetical protein